MYKEQFTKLEREILKFLFINAGESYNQRGIALALKVSPTAVANSIKNLDKSGLLELDRGKNTKPTIVELNIKNDRVFFLKRVENLRMIYESGLRDYLSDKLPETTIILFGSYSFGEDVQSSDIDIAVIGGLKKEIDFSAYEKNFHKKIVVQFYDSLEGIHRNLRESILNGIILKGSIKL